MIIQHKQHDQKALFATGYDALLYASSNIPHLICPSNQRISRPSCTAWSMIAASCIVVAWSLITAHHFIVVAWSLIAAHHLLVVAWSLIAPHHFIVVAWSLIAAHHFIVVAWSLIAAHHPIFVAWPMIALLSFCQVNAK